MSTSRCRSAFALVVTALGLGSAQLNAQTSLTSTSSAPAIAAPTAAQYDAGGPSATSSSWTVTAACDNGGGGTDCLVTLAFSSPSNVIPDVQWEFVGTPSGSGCSGAASAGFHTIAAGTVILTVQKNKTCQFTLAFRAPTLSYTAYTSPTTYVQGVAVIITKP